MTTQGFGQRQRQSQRQTITAHLAQTMALLSMNAMEIAEKIETELAENPALDMQVDNRCPTCKRKLRLDGMCTHCYISKEVIDNDAVVFISAKNDFRNGTSYRDSDGASFEDFSPEYEDLQTFVMRQITPDLEPSEQLIAAYIVTQLDEKGFLATTTVDIARYLHVLPSEIESVLSMIQQCEPVGIATRNAHEAMLVQTRLLAEQGDIPLRALEVIEYGIDLLSKKHYAELEEKLGVSEKEAKRIADFISQNLNPVPTRAYFGNQRHRSEDTPLRYFNPDVVINLQGDKADPQMIVEVLWPLRGRLLVDTTFVNGMKDVPEEKREEVQQLVDKAQLLVKCMNQRNHTMVRLMEQLSSLQRDYILKGEKHLKPITRASIADELEVHESTISRAVAGKTVQLPTGKIVPISLFFDRSLHIRTTLKQLIDQENKPLSDTKLANLLAKQGHKVARRTVAKYRAMEGILPAHMRK
jgi:RNA polymerase sigma-54 factor